MSELYNDLPGREDQGIDRRYGMFRGFRWVAVAIVLSLPLWALLVGISYCLWSLR